MKLIPRDGGVTALLGDNRVGLLSGRLVYPKLYLIMKIEITSDNPLLVGNAFLQWISRTHPDAEILPLSWDNAGDAAYARILRGLGYSVHEERVYYSRDLTDWKPSQVDPFQYRPAADLERAEFIRLLEELRRDDPDNPPGYPVDECFGYVLELLGAPASRGWRLAYLDGKVAGLCLPKLFEDEPEKGSLAYIALKPEFRGAGLSKVLHAGGLSELVKLRATQYLGSTHSENKAMRRVFESNGCSPSGTRQHWKRDR